MTSLYIIGAGLAGCIAGALSPGARLFEAGSGDIGAHKAVLRFRDQKLSAALSIPFQAVQVRKAIFSDDKLHDRCSIRHLNQYARKVIGRYEPRSISSLDTVTRYIAPDNLHEQLVERCSGRIQFNSAVNGISRSLIAIGDDVIERNDTPVISTAPMSVMLKATGETENWPTFRKAGIFTRRYVVPASTVHQTIYFPDASTDVYRATLTGQLLIIESRSEVHESDAWIVFNAFGLYANDTVLLDVGTQRFGKIDPLEDDVRKQILLTLTVRHHVFSLGRFACWRNILLDDVYEDFRKVQSLIKLGHYDLMRSMT